MSLGGIKNNSLPDKVKIEIPIIKQNETFLKSIKTRLYFKNLRQDVQPLYGLQDWPVKEWRAAFSSVHAKELSKTLNIKPGYNELLKKIDEGLLLDEWVEILKFQNKYMNGKFETDPNRLYVHDTLLSNSIHRQMFPLGIFDEQDWEFAVRNSGLYSVEHKLSNRNINIIMLSLMIFSAIGLVTFLAVVLNKEYWNIEHTIQNVTTDDILYRTKERGTLATMLGGITFSLFVNAGMDVFGKIDPSTSTALIGIFLGNTWGFVLDNMLGTDEGYREYLWNTQDGMRFALGCLYSAKFMRYMITLVFDMFFTVILFKQFYPLILRTAGFSIKGREWIANSFVSTLITLTTFQVYANMTRFRWAYPSGDETIYNEWISGPTMLLSTVVMNMVYLTTETRTRQGEPGINNPTVKSFVTIFTFIVLIYLQNTRALDPSGIRPIFIDESVSKPLYNVCETQNVWTNGLMVYLLLSVICMGIVIFGTSQLVLFKSQIITKIFLLVVFMFINILIILFFSFVPLFKENSERNMTFACEL